MRAFLAGIGMLALLGASTVLAGATSLSVSPTTLDMMAPDSAAVINLRNAAKKAVNVQVRVFRWSQQGGQEKLVPTTAVVASPPSAKLAPNQDYVLRVLRVGKAPVDGEESYRVLVDEVPLKSDRRGGAVNLVVRHSIPVFFRAVEASSPDVAWSVGGAKGGLVLTARNTGATRLKISDLMLSQGGKAVANRKGLVGYVLGGSTMAFSLGGAKGLSGGPVVIKANSDLGPFDAKAAVKK